MAMTYGGERKTVTRARRTARTRLQAVVPYDFPVFGERKVVRRPTGAKCYG
jgi:hypothetical protein